MPVKRRTPKVRITGFPDWQIQFLETGELPPESIGDVDENAPNCFELINWQHHTACPDDPVLPVWEACREKILRQWIERHPGSRPFVWWRFDAPEPGRQRVGGTGTPAHEVLCYKPHFVKGIPTYWITAFDAAYYNGLARDIHGNLIKAQHRDGSLRKPGDFAGVAIDPDNPPLFESQAAYLERLGLLVKGERTALKAAQFTPEPLPQEYCPTR